MGKKVKIPLVEYNEIKQNIQMLEQTWQRLLTEKINDWYEFKYSSIVEKFLSENEKKQTLFAHSNYKSWSKKVQLEKSDYQYLLELSTISAELQRVLKYPPFGVKNYQGAFNQASEFIDY